MTDLSIRIQADIASAQNNLRSLRTSMAELRAELGATPKGADFTKLTADLKVMQQQARETRAELARMREELGRAPPPQTSGIGAASQDDLLKARQKSMMAESAEVLAADAAEAAAKKDTFKALAAYELEQQRVVSRAAKVESSEAANAYKASIAAQMAADAEAARNKTVYTRRWMTDVKSNFKEMQREQTSAPNKSMGDAMRATDVTNSAAIIRSGYSSTAAEAEKLAKSTEKVGITGAFAAQKLRAITDEAIAGRWAQMNGSVAGLVFKLVEATAAASATTMGMVALGAAGAAVGGVFAYLQYQIYEARKAAMEAAGSIAAIGNAGNFNNLISSSQQAVQYLTKVNTWIDNIGLGAAFSASEAQQLVTVFGSISGASDQLTNGLGEIARTLHGMFSADDVVARMKSFAAALDDPEKAGLKLVEGMRNLSLAERAEIETAIQSGNENQKRAAILNLIIRQVQLEAEAHLLTEARAKATTKAQKDLVDTNEELLKSGLPLLSMEREFGDALQAQQKIIEKNVTAWKARATALSAQPVSAGVIADAASKAMEGDIESQLRVIQSTMDKLKSVSTSDMAAAATAIKGIESSGGDYGAQGPTNPRSGDHAYGAYQVMGANIPSWTKEVTGSAMTPEQFLANKGAQDQVFLVKFGELMLKYGPEGAAQHWLGTGKHDVNGTTPGAYGQDFMGRYAKAGGGQSGDRAGFDLGQQADKALQLKDALAGGTAVQKELIAAAERAAAGRKNDVVDAQKLVDANQKMLDNAQKEGASEATLGQLRKSLADAEDKHSQAQLAVEKSRYDVAAARAKEGSPEEKSAKLGAVDTQIKGAGGDEAKTNALLAQKQQIIDQYDKQATADAASQEEIRFSNEKKGFERSLDLIRAQVKEKQLSGRRGTAQEVALLQQEEAAEQAHQAKMAGIYQDDPKKFREAEQKKAEIAAEYAKKITDVQIKDQEQIAQQYQHTFGQITSIVGGAFTSMITSHERLRAAAKQMLDGIINMFASAIEKIAAEWLSKMALMAAANVLTGGAAGAASGGLGGLLSALPHFAAGSWELPGDMVAQVHKGEMIIPASQAASIRNGSTGGALPGAGGGRGGGNSTQIHLHALDGPSAKSFLKNNASAIGKAMNDHARTGGALSLNRLR